MVKYTKRSKKPKKKYTQQDSLENFNRHYGFCFCFDEKEIDTCAAQQGAGLYIARDLSRISFPVCETLTMSIPNFQLKDLRPKMPLLKTLRIIHGTMRKLYLPLAPLKMIETLDLTDNDFELADNLYYAKTFPNLKKLIVAENPIAANANEKAKLDAYLVPITVIYD